MDFKYKIIGSRPGEKIHEMLVSEHEALRTIEYSDFKIILPDNYKHKLRFQGCDKMSEKEYTSKKIRVLSECQNNYYFSIFQTSGYASRCL